ncbi:MAG: cobalamin B12-binding domain-containing protein [Dehalococcoidales bacterium]|nr:cobalamin B12-binding domain-containing protein [Dehalococcoidales bacterium]
MLDRLDREQCVSFITGKLAGHEIDIVELYQEILTPAQYEDLCKDGHANDCIWQEHVRTSIIRTIIECCYPYVLKERDHKYVSTLKSKVFVVCPTEELHEIGARMIADYFTLCGYNVLFIGANTPQKDILHGIKYFSPEFVAISITNYYNLMAARNTVQRITGLKGVIPFKVILGGQACRNNPAACGQMGADMILDTFDDIRSLAGRQE